MSPSSLSPSPCEYRAGQALVIDAQPPPPMPAPVSSRAAQSLKIPETPALGACPDTAPLRPRLLSLSPSSQVCLLEILFWLERGGGGVCVSGSFLLSHSSSLPPSCLSRCFLCQSGHTPGSLLLSSRPLPPGASADCGFPLMPSVSRRGVQGTYPSGWGPLPPPSPPV